MEAQLTFPRLVISVFTRVHRPFDKGARESDPGAYAASQRPLHLFANIEM